jgi:hypothetical protein
MYVILIGGQAYPLVMFPGKEVMLTARLEPPPP